MIAYAIALGVQTCLFGTWVCCKHGDNVDSSTTNMALGAWMCGIIIWPLYVAIIGLGLAGFTIYSVYLICTDGCPKMKKSLEEHQEE